nr:MAG TPA: hypothetical protein [Caudoviricetes sp.]
MLPNDSLDSITLSDFFGIPIVEERNYWLVRTNSGRHYQDFTTNSYIAIGWDYISVNMIEYEDNEIKNEDFLKALISQDLDQKKSSKTDDDIEDELDETATENPEERKSSTITKTLNKIKTFIFDFSIGDIVIIPSTNSSHISIGQITSDIYEDPSYIADYLKNSPGTAITLCPFQKRRDVQWLKSYPKESLDIYLLKALRPHEALYKLNDYAPIINRNIYDVYTIGNEMHSIIRTTQESEMSLSDLKALVDFFDTTLSYPDDEFGKISSKQVFIKLNIHSPGLMELTTSTAAIGMSASLSLILFNALLYEPTRTYIIEKMKAAIKAVRSKLSNAREALNGVDITLNIGTEGFEGHLSLPDKEEQRLENRKLAIEESRLERDNRQLDQQERIIDLWEKMISNNDNIDRLLGIVQATQQLGISVPRINASNNTDTSDEDVNN